MKLWVDADACPRAIKEVIYRAADRMKIQSILVANQFLRVPKSPYIKAIQVPSGFDIADASQPYQTQRRRFNESSNPNLGPGYLLAGSERHLHQSAGWF